MRNFRTLMCAALLVGMSIFFVSPAQDITAALLGNSLHGTGHTAQALVDSDAEVGVPPGVPEPATLLLFGAALIGLAGYVRKKFKKVEGVK